MTMREDRGTAADMDKTERTDLLQGVKTETTDRQTDRHLEGSDIFGDMILFTFGVLGVPFLIFLMCHAVETKYYYIIIK